MTDIPGAGKRWRLLPIFAAIVITALIMSNIATAQLLLNADTKNQQTGSMTLTANVTIKQGNHVMISQDPVQMDGGLDTLLCKVFNMSSACATASSHWAYTGAGEEGTACSYYDGTASATGFYSDSGCSINAIGLSSDTSAVGITSVCEDMLLGNGLSPQLGTSVTPSGSIPLGSGAIALSTQFTPTVSGTTISTICLLAWNFNAKTYSFQYTTPAGQTQPNTAAFAIDLLSSPYTTTSGTAFTVSWQLVVALS